jgi:prepilin-type N-terminal cleavage/methylation domain-containing protein
MMRPILVRPRANGFTLIELMVVVVVASVILMLAAPSFRNMIEMQRLRAAKSQLVTDMQFARSEATARNQFLRVAFRHTDGVMTCYSLYTAPSNAEVASCNCLLGPGSACPVGSTEVRTVQHPDNLGVKVQPPTEPPNAFAFDPVTGGIYSVPFDTFSSPMEKFEIDVFLNTPRTFRTIIGRSGRPQVCKPSTSTIDEVACPS